MALPALGGVMEASACAHGTSILPELPWIPFIFRAQYKILGSTSKALNVLTPGNLKDCLCQSLLPRASPGCSGSQRNSVGGHLEKGLLTAEACLVLPLLSFQMSVKMELFSWAFLEKLTTLRILWLV